MSEAFIIEHDIPITKVVGRGRKRGSGFNLKMLNKMKQGDCISDIPEKKMHSIRVSASKATPPISLRIRRMPPIEGRENVYMIWKL
jgi:hypothetical protein